MAKYANHENAARLAMLGQRIDKFDLLTPLARIGNTELWLVNHAQHRWQKSSLLLNRKDLRQQQERAQRQQSWPVHPLLLQPKDTGSTHTLDYQVYEPITGTPVAALKRAADERRQALDPVLCARVVAQVVEAVELLGAERPEHRQEFPVGVPSMEHLFFAQGSTIKLLDGAWRLHDLDIDKAIAVDDVHEAGALLLDLLHTPNTASESEQEATLRAELLQLAERTLTHDFELRFTDLAEFGSALQLFLNENAERLSENFRAFNAAQEMPPPPTLGMPPLSAIPTQMLPICDVDPPSRSRWLWSHAKQLTQAALVSAGLMGSVFSYWAGHHKGSNSTTTTLATAVTEEVSEPQGEFFPAIEEGEQLVHDLDEEEPATAPSEVQ